MSAGGPRSSDVTIVVLNWNGGSDTLDCLESLAAARLDGASVLVVDNGSRDDSLARIRARFPAQRILALPDNRGYAGGNNAGMRAALEAGAGAVLLLNNDTRVAPDFLPPLLQVLEDSPRAAAVTSQILRLDQPEMLDVAYLEVHFDERNVVQLQGVNRLPSEGFDRRRQVYVVPGCSVLFRSAALREVGLFDESFFAYHEDVDWCLRAHQLAWEVYYEPFSRVFHKGSRSTERFNRKPVPRPWRPDAPQLPHAEAMPFNPVRTYLGMRNTVRLLARYAKPTHRLAFGLDLARLLPLETTAVILGAESEYRLGRWSWRNVADAYLGAARDGRGTLARAAALPLAIGWRFPRDLIRAARSGRLAEVAETLRGLRDGLLGRRLPLERLGLR
jgi:GT2 family glycosyltransferase